MSTMFFYKNKKATGISAAFRRVNIAHQHYQYINITSKNQ